MAASCRISRELVELKNINEQKAQSRALCKLYLGMIKRRSREELLFITKIYNKTVFRVLRKTKINRLKNLWEKPKCFNFKSK